MLRKVLHVAFGLGALLLRWLAPWQTALLLIGAAAFNLLLLDRLTGRSLLRPDERRRGFSWGVVSYPVALLAALAVFRNRLELVAAIWALLAFGDGMAGLCGRLVRGPRLPWNPRKTWSGFVAFVLYGTALSAFALRWTQHAVVDVARFRGDGPVDWIGLSFLTGPSQVVHLLLACSAAALAAAVAESLDVPVDDNLTVPLVGGSVLWLATLVV